MLDLERPVEEETVGAPPDPDPRDRWHVCVVTETFPPEVNGVAHTLGQLIAGLRRRGHFVSVVRPRQAGDPVGEMHDPTLALVPGVTLPGYAAVQAGLPAGPVLRARWRRRPPDVIYVATEGPLGWSALRAARRFGLPALTGLHTNFHHYARHYRLGWAAPLVAAYLRWFHNRSAGTLVATAALADQAHHQGFRNVSVLGRGVDARRFGPDHRSATLRGAWGVADGDPVAICVGRVAPEKNVQLAIDAYRAMREHAPATRLVVVGDGPLRAALERRHPDVVFTGMLTGEPLAAHFASADLFLFPSETETFGNVTLEALASGLAVVAYDYAAARAHVLPGRTGLVAQHGDAAAFTAAAVALARDPDLLARMRTGAAGSVAHLHWDRVVERFETLLWRVACLSIHAGLVPGEPASVPRSIR